MGVCGPFFVNVPRTLRLLFDMSAKRDLSVMRDV